MTPVGADRHRFAYSLTFRRVPGKSFASGSNDFSGYGQQGEKRFPFQIPISSSMVVNHELVADRQELYGDLRVILTSTRFLLIGNSVIDVPNPELP